MDRALPLLLLAALTAPMMAGCTAQAGAVASADEIRPGADEAARAWAADARLVTLVGVEGTWTDFDFGESASMEQTESARGDDAPDGKATMWALEYVSSSKARTLVVLADAEGRVLQSEEDEPHEDDVPLGAYSIDSDEAVRKALATNDDLRQSQEKKQSGMVSVLGQDDEDRRPMWVITGAASDGSGGVVILDARTGDVLVSMDFDGGWDGAWGWDGTWDCC